MLEQVRAHVKRIECMQAHTFKVYRVYRVCVRVQAHVFIVNRACRAGASTATEYRVKEVTWQ